MITAAAPNWAEQVVAIATAILALGVVGAVGAAVFGAQQVREERRTRQAQMAAEFFRRWDDDALIEARRLIANFSTPDELASAFARYVADNSTEAYTLYRELDFFEQLAALERSGAFDLELIDLLVGRSLVERWEMWRPALRAVHGEDAYPLFRDLAARMRRAEEGRDEPRRGVWPGRMLRT